MAESVGRREASKQEVRSALLAAATALFEERGFEATTVRDIARAAGVTERTLYRYFDGKEGLLGDEFQSWQRQLHDAIVARPAAEPPAVAVQRAMLAFGQHGAGGGDGVPQWLQREGIPVTSLRRSAPRPLRQLEASICDALRIRAGAGATDADAAFRAQVISRVAVAAVRSAMIFHREQSQAGSAATPRQLLESAFAIIGADWQPAEAG